MNIDKIGKLMAEVQMDEREKNVASLFWKLLLFINTF